MESNQNKNELYLYPITGTYHLGSIYVKGTLSSNSIQTVVLLDCSTSMGKETPRFLREILPLVMSKLNSNEGLHLICYASFASCKYLTPTELLSAPNVIGSRTNMAFAIHELRLCLQSIQKDHAGQPIRVLTVCDGMINDRQSAEVEAKKLVDFLDPLGMTINSQAVRLFTTTTEQPDTQALCYLLQINNTCATDLCDIAARESNEAIATTIAGLFQSDGFGTCQTFQVEDALILKCPWNSYGSTQTLLSPGWNIFWLRLPPTGVVMLGSDHVKVVVERQLSIAKFHQLLETKLTHISDHMTILKIVDTVDANREMDEIREYFKKTENALANTSSSKNIISHLLDLIAKNETIYDFAQMAEFLRNSKKQTEMLNRKEIEARERDKQEVVERIRRRKEEQERVRREEDERLKREEDERLKREEDERLKREEDERLKREEDERLKREEEERLKRQEEQRFKREEEERLKRQEEERVKREEEERLKREVDERLNREEEERLKREEEERLKREEEERLKREEEERLKREEEERLKRKEEKLLKREEEERLKREEQERVRREEEERLKREEEERLKREKQERVRREEEERLKREEEEHARREEEERARREEEKRLKREEEEYLKRKEQVRVRQEEEDHLKREEQERLRREEEVRLKRVEEECVRREEERIKREKECRNKRVEAERERIKREEQIRKVEELDRIRGEEEERICQEEEERCRREEEKRMKQEEDHAKRAGKEAARIMQKELNRDRGRAVESRTKQGKEEKETVEACVKEEAEKALEEARVKRKEEEDRIKRLEATTERERITRETRVELDRIKLKMDEEKNLEAGLLLKSDAKGKQQTLDPSNGVQHINEKQEFTNENVFVEKRTAMGNFESIAKISRESRNKSSLITTAASKVRKLTGAIRSSRNSDINPKPFETVFILHENVSEAKSVKKSWRFAEKIIPLVFSKISNGNSQLVHLLTVVTEKTPVVQMLQSILQTLDANKPIRVVVLTNVNARERQPFDNFADTLIKFLNGSNFSFELQVIRIASESLKSMLGINKYQLLDIDSRKSNAFIATQIVELFHSEIFAKHEPHRMVTGEAMASPTDVVSLDVDDEQPTGNVRSSNCEFCQGNNQKHRLSSYVIYLVIFAIPITLLLFDILIYSLKK